MQSKVTLSTTNAEYFSLPSALQDVIPLMNSAKNYGISLALIFSVLTLIFFHAFEDDSGALEIAQLPKMHPRTKHINICYHHFREHVR